VLSPPSRRAPSYHQGTTDSLYCRSTDVDGVTGETFGNTGNPVAAARSPADTRLILPAGTHGHHDHASTGFTNDDDGTTRPAATGTHPSQR
jgi:hypothetical protein